MNKTTRTVLIGVVGVAIVAALGWFVVLPRLAPSVVPYMFHGQTIQSDQAAPSVELESADGTVRLSDYEGEVVVLYFGYTFCPDVCPITLSKLDRAMDILGDKAEDVQVIMISVDPARDTPEMLKEYVAHFNEDFIGITGDPNSIDRIATTYGVYYEAEEGSEATGYLVNHTATVMVIDRDGYMKLVLPFEGTAEDIAADIDFFVSR
ncbi:MAG: SCO family protein [Actinomycetota bacterium]|nr:SCO family protein [Actinomycetota bacterium]